MARQRDAKDDVPTQQLHLWQFQAVRDLLFVAAVAGIVWLGYALRAVTVPLLVALLLFLVLLLVLVLVLLVLLLLLVVLVRPVLLLLLAFVVLLVLVVDIIFVVIVATFAVCPKRQCTWVVNN